RGGLPKDAEHARLVIVGTGLSGLSAAWHLKKYDPVMIEGASRFGGNAKGQKWGDLSYGIGSAYFTKDERWVKHIQMCRSLGLHRLWREDDPTEDQMYKDGKISPLFWFGGSDPARKADFRAAWRHFEI